MKSLPPIPTPPALRWREFRVRFLPFVVFASALAASVWIWNQHLAAPTLVGEVEVRRAHVASVRPGLVVKLGVDQFAEVQVNELVAVVEVSEPRYLESLIGVAKAEAEVLRLQLDPMLTAERLRVDTERLRLDLLNERVLLASEKVQLRYAEAEYDRLAALRSAGDDLVSLSEVELALRERDALREQLSSRSNLIQHVEASVEQKRPSGPPSDESPVPEGWRLALDLQERKIQEALAEFGPVELRAPITGTVSMVYRRSGENVAAGEPILTITATRAERIHAFLLPGSRVEPQPGMAVEVRSRSGRRAVGYGTVEYVAHHLDLIDSSVVLSANRRLSWNVSPAAGAAAPGTTMTTLPVGRPLSITVPEELDLLPGEPVELRFLEEGLPLAAARSAE